MTTMDDYVGRCRATVIGWSERLPSDGVDWAMHLIDHGEPAEGLCSLAWAIDEAGIRPTATEASEIRTLIGDLVPESGLPESFQRSTRP